MSVEIHAAVDAITTREHQVEPEELAGVLNGTRLPHPVHWGSGQRELGEGYTQTD